MLYPGVDAYGFYVVDWVPRRQYQYWCWRAKGCKAGNPLVDEERMRPGHWLGSVLCVSSRALTFLVGWNLSPEVLFWGKLCRKLSLFGWVPHHHTTAVLRPFFRDQLGEPVPGENFHCTLWCKGRLTEADTLTIRLGITPSGLTSAYIHHLPIFFTGRMPFLPPYQQHQGTEGN